MTTATPPSIPLNILVLDDERSIVVMLQYILEKENHKIVTASAIREANGHLSALHPDVAVVDVYLGDEDGLQYVRSLRERFGGDLGIIVISTEDTETLANKALDSGADYFLSKPIAPAALLLTVKKLGELRSERQRVLDLERELDRSMRDTAFPEIVTNSDAMRAVLRLVEKVGPRDLSVLVCGESGTGKELLARAIHNQSSRRNGNFVELNCAALPPNLVESELFGHEKGAFTGAIASRPGKIQMASGGTLFLDEIGELPLEIQPKLLRALQEKRVIPVGGKEPISSDFRLISATNRDLVKEVKESRFREDLFYRVAVFPIKIPSLRERMEDLDVLLAHFLRQEGLGHARISREALMVLHQHQWKGNVRELKNFAQAIPLFSENGVIDETSVRAYFGSRLEGNLFSEPMSPIDNRPNRPVRKIEELQHAEILYALSFYKGNVSEAARALGMGRATLYKYIKRHDLQVQNGT